MNDQIELHERAKLTARKYFPEVEEWSTPVLIEELEALAYQIAREGDNREATELFMLVAELSMRAASRNHERVKSNTSIKVPPKMEDGRD